MRHTWIRVLIGTTAIVLVALGFGLWPSALGGKTVYVSTRGTSMEPTFRQDDLALVRPASGYEVGDVIAYRSEVLDGTVVLHRIIGRSDTGFRTQGDNNSFVDKDEPTEADILGKLWHRVPQGGRGLRAARAGLPLLLGGLGVLGAAAGSRRNRRKRPAHLAPRLPTASAMRWWQGANLGLAGTAGIAVAFGALAFAAGPTALANTTLPYRQQGTFSYTGTATAGTVYPDGEVRTGDPVFRRLVEHVDVTFDYQVTTAEERALAGTLAMRTELSTASGWTRTIDEVAAAAFSGDGGSAAIRIDLAHLERVLADVEAATGVKMGAATVSVLPDAQVVGTVGQQRLDQTFAPRLDFTLEPLQLRLRDPDSQLETASAATLTHTARRPNRLEAFGLAMPVGVARTLSLAVGLPAAAAAAAGTVALRRRLRGEVDRIELRHGHRIVPVAPTRMKDVIEVTSMGDLARLAEQHASLILHRQPDDGGHEYQMQADGVVYRYRAREERPPPSRLLG